MHIAFLTSEYPHEKTGSSGGIGTSIKNLALGLIAQEHKVIVLVYAQERDEIFYDGKIEIHCIKNIKVKGISWFLTRKKIEKYIDKLYAQNKIEIIEAPDWTGITSFIKPKKCPVVIKLHGSDTYFCYLDKRKVKAINKFHEKRALKNADGHIAVSKFVAEITNQVFKQNISYNIIHNGVDLNNFNISESKNDDKLSILYLGTLIRKKGLLELPLIFNEVIKSIPNAELILVGADSVDILTGETSTWKLMSSLFTDEAIKQVKYIGKVPYEKVNQIISEATICVFPSFAEAFPVSWLEAMAKGKAVVASNIGWAPEVIENKLEGILISPKNHMEYANAIISIFKDDQLKQNIQVNARTKVENSFDINLIVKQNIAYYKSLIDKL